MRIPTEVARRVKDGHPFVFSEALRGRKLTFAPGQSVPLFDNEGKFTAMAVFDPEGNPPLRVFSRQEGTRLDAAWIRRHVTECVVQRRRLFGEGPEICCRVLSGDSEGIPSVTVDRYGGYLVVCSYSQVADSYRAPLLEALVAEMAPAGIYLQRRFVAAVPGRPRPAAELVFGHPASPEVIVAEGRTRFVVDVSSPAGTGLYPDMRRGREAVARLAGGRRVLNCFSYAGAFSVVAALHGATAVASVDAAARAHGRARRNFSENRIDLETEAYEFITGDTFAVLSRMAARHRRFDLVILDPPTFSSGKGRIFTAMKDYAELVAAALEVTSPGGILCAASNAAKLPASDLDRAIGRGASLAGREAVIEEQLGLPPDFPTLPAFPESAYLKFFVVRTS